MSIERKLIGTTDAAAAASVYVEDVFSTYLYTGTVSDQTINNGIDLATKGGMVWIKGRNVAIAGAIYDTVRGPTNALETSNTAAQYNAGYLYTGSFLSNGYIDRFGWSTSQTVVSWTFRKQAKFFTIATWTGDGASSKTVSHDLGCVPGMIITKGTSGATDWPVYHKSLANTEALRLNDTAAKSTIANFGNTTPTASNFYVGSNNNVNGYTYVAYLFADSNSGGFGPAGTDSVVACGSYTGNSGSTSNVTAPNEYNGPDINLGWEPQWLLVKNTSAADNWWLLDNMRGFAVDISQSLAANSSSAESPFGPSYRYLKPTSTGFKVTAANGAYFNEQGNNYIYLAIRRGPMKTPTDATKVFAPVVWTGNNTPSRKISTGLLSPPDLSVTQFSTDAQANLWWDRLRGISSVQSGSSAYIRSPQTDAENLISQYYYAPTMTEVGFGDTSSGSLQLNGTGTSVVAWNFRRAPGFFDVVCFSSSANATQRVTHNLGAIPELIITKERGTTGQWYSYVSTLGISNFMRLNLTAASTSATNVWGSSNPTSTDFGIDTSASGTGYTTTVVAYLFATCAGVSKVGSYTGTGTTKQIDCGFAAGARFVLIKRTDSTGSWYVWDSARGIVSGNDPYLLLNSTAAEVTNTDYIDPYSAGFEISSTAPAEINASGGSFVFLAIA